LKILYEPDEDGRYEIVETCKYCGKIDPYFREPAIMRNHIKNKCKGLLSCEKCQDRVRKDEIKAHLLYHCRFR
jgi:hypothetical protein